MNMRLIVVLLLLVSTVAIGQKKKKEKEKEPAPVSAPQQQTTPTAPPQSEAQPADSTPTASMILTDHFLRKYAAAVRWADVDMARSALYDIIVENPQNDSLIYTLAYYYYDEQKYAPSLLICQDLLQLDPKNVSYLEMAASSAQQLGVLDRALGFYETLFLGNNNIRTLYQIAFLQYSLKRLAESTNSVNMLLERPEALTEKVVFDDAAGKAKEYPIKVSVLNLKGLVALEQKDKVAAKKAFTDALAISPDFLPAKQNLEKTK